MVSLAPLAPLALSGPLAQSDLSQPLIILVVAIAMAGLATVARWRAS